MSFNLGSAQGHIRMTYDGSGVRQANRDMDQLQSKAQQGEVALQNTANAMGKAGLVIAGGLALAVNAAASFEQRLSAIQAVSGATEDDMARISEKALQLGKDTAFSATEAASAIEELIKAGLSVEDVLNGAADATVNLAAAGEIELKEAATIASNAMNQFGVTAEGMTEVVDAIAGAANASAIDVGEFGQSLQQVGAVANLAGVSFKDTATAIAIMGNAGIRGSDAGTSLKTMFQRLQPVTVKQKEAMEELGLITEDGTNKFYDQQGNMKSLAQVSQILQDSMKGMTAQQKQATLQTLFGSDAIRGAAILAEAGAKGFNNMADAMGKVSAQKVAETRMDNVRGKLEELKGSLETAGIVIGTIFLPAVTSIVQGLTDFLELFLSLNPEMQRFVGYAAAAAAGALLLAAGIIKLVFFIQSAAAAFSAIGALLAANPIVLIIAGIIAAAVAFAILYKRSEAFRNFIHTQLIPVFQAFYDAVAPIIMSFVNLIRENWSEIERFTLEVWNRIKPIIMGIVTIWVAQIKILLAIIRAQLAVIKAIWNKWGDEIMAIVKFVFKSLGMFIKAGLRIIQGIIDVFAGILTGDWRRVWNGLQNIVGGKLDMIKALFRTTLNAMKLIARLVWSAIRNIFGGALGGIRSIVTTLTNAAASAFKSIWSSTRAVISAIWNGIKTAIMTPLNLIDSALRAFGVGGAADLVAQAFDNIKAAVDAVADAIGWLIDQINSIPTPDLPDLPDLPDIGIPGLASGGIVTQPTLALVGEGGENEWVVPESKLFEWLGGDPRNQRSPSELREPVTVDRGSPQINIYNPEAERASDSLMSRLVQLSEIGII